jgi:flavin reductase (DIM6/NTAB) family NADH-FMN oxidoreductase RutF
MQKYITYDELLNMEQRQRATFINSVGGFKSACLIGTIDKVGLTNLAIFNSIVHLGASPPLIAFIVRPNSAERNTLDNIIETKHYTMNHINEQIYKKAHQTSARYPKEISEFDSVGLTAEYKNNFSAPYVKESNVQLGILFKERIDLSINSTILIIGQIQHLYFPKNCLSKDGYLDLEKANTITCSGLDSYHKTERLERLAYAKPNAKTEIIKMNYID